MLSCNCCESTGRFDEVFSLGKLPLGNSLLEEKKLALPEPIFAIDLVRCKKCHFMQLKEPIPEKYLRDEYRYFSSASPTTIKHCSELADKLISDYCNTSYVKVIEVGSNDGTLLEIFQKCGLSVLGVEPVKEVADLAIRRKIPTEIKLFSSQVAKQLVKSQGQADVLIAMDVLEIVPNPNDFVNGLRILVKYEGVVVIEVLEVREIIVQGRFDAIAHDHFSWFTFPTLVHLLSRQGLRVFDIEKFKNFRGGMLRVFATPNKKQPISLAVDKLFEEEREYNYSIDKKMGLLQQKVRRFKDELGTFLHTIVKEEKKHVVAYGAGIRSSLLLNLLQNPGELIDYVVDGNDRKHGFYLPGAHIKICSPSVLNIDHPDYVLLLALSYVDEILAQQSQYRQAGGKFIIPLPELKVI